MGLETARVVKGVWVRACGRGCYSPPLPCPFLEWEIVKHIKELRYRQKGHLGQYEDWWDLFQMEDGSFVVRHSWDHVKTGTGQADRGETIENATEAEISAARADPAAAAKMAG